MTTEQRDKLRQTRQILGAAQFHAESTGSVAAILANIELAEETISAVLNEDEPNAEDWACFHQHCQSYEDIGGHHDHYPEDYALRF